jgi:hypothetical protein
MASEANRLAPLNVLNDSLPYGRFSGDHVWPDLGVHRGVEVWLHREPVDFRRQINGLVLIVEQEMKGSPRGLPVSSLDRAAARKERTSLAPGSCGTQLPPMGKLVP